MKCPNIYCLMHENGNCIWTDEDCAYKDKYESDHCPTEEEYNTKQKILHLTMKKFWYDLIWCGVKKEEYREIKPYWTRRLTTNGTDFIDFDTARFYHGYKQPRPQFDAEIVDIRIGFGKEEWGAESGKKYYVIELDEIYTDLPF